MGIGDQPVVGAEFSPFAERGQGHGIAKVGITDQGLLVEGEIKGLSYPAVGQRSPVAEHDPVSRQHQAFEDTGLALGLFHQVGRLVTGQIGDEVQLARQEGIDPIAFRNDFEANFFDFRNIRPPIVFVAYEFNG